MRAKWIWLYAMLVGCAHAHEGVDRELVRLRSQLDSVDNRLGDLQNQMLVLGDRLQARETELSSIPKIASPAPAPAATPAPQPSTPPPNPSKTIEHFKVSTSDSGELVATRVPSPDTKTEPTRGSTQAFATALAEYERGDRGSAYQAFARFAEQHPKDKNVPSAWFWMGLCQLEEGRFEAAIVDLQKLVARFPSNTKTPDALFQMGLAYEQLARPDLARQTFESLVRAHPRSAVADLARARL